jgi:hypothetical protein
MPILVTKATAPEHVLAATRGPDNYEYRALKFFTTAVIRSWITDWQYGDISYLPFVAFPDSVRSDTPHWFKPSPDNHFFTHLVKAAYALSLPVVWIPVDVFDELSKLSALPLSVHNPSSKQQYHWFFSSWINAFPGARELCGPMNQEDTGGRYES